jgi:hypothetical protein
MFVFSKKYCKFSRRFGEEGRRQGSVQAVEGVPGYQAQKGMTSHAEYQISLWFVNLTGDSEFQE